MQPDWRLIYSDYALDHYCPEPRDIINADPAVRRLRNERLAKRNSSEDWKEVEP